MITVTSADNLISHKDLKGDKKINEFPTWNEARDYGYNDCDWTYNRMEQLGITIIGTYTIDKLITQKKIGDCENIGMGVYVNLSNKKVYTFVGFYNNKYYYKEYLNCIWKWN